jgi:hypothetical protein
MTERGEAVVDGQSTLGNNQSLVLAGGICARVNVLLQGDLAYVAC